MKKLIAVFAMVAMSLVGVQAFTLWVPNSNDRVITLEEKVKISPNELPAPVKTTIDNNFSDWEIAAAYLFTE